MAVLQVVVSGGVLFLLYRYLLQTIGTEQVGIWVIVLASASASRVSEMGLTGSAVKFTARYIARGDKHRAAEVIETTTITIGVVLAAGLAAGYPVAIWLMGYIIPTLHVPAALSILPYALVSVWMGAVSGVFLSGLDGCQRIDLRVLVTILGGIAFLVLTWVLVPKNGLIGLGVAQVMQGMATSLVGWLLLRRSMCALPVLPFRWNPDLFREMFRYGMNFQFVSLAQIIFEPMTKVLLSKFGGLDVVSYFEMANRLVIQCRALMVSANQVIVPVVAGMHEATPARIRGLYRDSYQLLLYLAVPLFAGLASMIPIASELWIGRYEASFVSFAVLLVGGWFLNTLVGPAYFANLGTGRLRWNTLSHAAIGILNGVMGTIFGIMFGAIGVVTGFVIALGVGSAVVIGTYHLENRIPLSELFPREHGVLVVTSVLGAVVTWGSYYALRNHGSIRFVGVICIAGFIGIVVPSVWAHPMRARVIGWFITSRKANAVL